MLDSSSPSTTDNITFTVDPFGTLGKGVPYYVRIITTGVKDTSGNELSNEIAFSFTTYAR